jgi:hypothetical protein
MNRLSRQLAVLNQPSLCKWSQWQTIWPFLCSSQALHTHWWVFIFKASLHVHNGKSQTRLMGYSSRQLVLSTLVQGYSSSHLVLSTLAQGCSSSHLVLSTLAQGYSFSHLVLSTLAQGYSSNHLVFSTLAFRLAPLPPLGFEDAATEDSDADCRTLVAPGPAVSVLSSSGRGVLRARTSSRFWYMRCSWRRLSCCFFSSKSCNSCSSCSVSSTWS